jgi:Ca2+-binding EF-hand superfamily protein
MTKELRVGRAISEAAVAGLLLALAMPLPLLALNGSWHAQQQAQQAPQPSFDQADRNRDGFIDKSEAAIVPGLSANFEKMDTNKDGKLDRGEFEKALVALDSKK